MCATICNETTPFGKPVASKPEYSAAAFALTITRAMLFFSAILALVLLFGIFVIAAGQSFRWNAPLVLLIGAGLYLSFGASWGLAYAKFFHYPERRNFLIMGSDISPMVMLVAVLLVTTFWPPDPLIPGQPVPFAAIVVQLAIVYAALVLTAGLQVFGVAIALRHFIQMRLPF